MIYRRRNQNEFDAASGDKYMRECHHNQVKTIELTMIAGSMETRDGLQVSQERDY
jgi:hypothetical protein